MADLDRDRFEDEEDEEGAIEEPSKPFFQTLIGRIVIIAVVLIFIILSTLVVSNAVFDARISSMDKEEVEETEGSINLVENPQTFAIGDMNLNLETPGDYLSVNVFLAYDGDNENLRWELDMRKFQIVSIVRYILESNTKEEIDSVEERDDYLKPKIKNSINDILQNGQIHAVYFSKFTIQYSPVN